ncbi:MAG: UDP-galactopyranose mutase [Victivallaceae bacterium]|nr:UDP-galactopyranose mutase [Victivallaceae bacterium]
MKKLYVVGCGFFGAVVAERAASAGIPVTIFEKRNHIGGNSFSCVDEETGVEYHKYGSHIFHTSDEKVWQYVNRFGKFNDYRHHVFITCRNEVFSMPINLGTVNQFYRKAMTPEEAERFLAREIARDAVMKPKNLEEKVISLIGRPLYEAFICGYTAKQWETSPQELSADIIKRIPVRYNYNNRYFSDRYEGIPLDGYGNLFRRILSHPAIEVCLDTPFADVAASIPAGATILYTGCADEFFDYRFGRLEWRSVDFKMEKLNIPDYQGCTVMNYGDREVPYTRIHEFKHYHPERPDTGKTIICREFSRFAREGDEPAYPVFTEKNRALHQKYLDFGRENRPDVIFGGRLGRYQYLDMDDVIAAALQCFADEIAPRFL